MPAGWATLFQREIPGEILLSYDKLNVLFQVDFIWIVGWSLRIQGS